MSEERDALREMARHHGFQLVASRRRKPGGDFGRYGLKDTLGHAAFGIGSDGLATSADEIATFLRDAARATWVESAGSAPRARKPKTPPRPPKPRPKPKPLPKLQCASLFERLPAARRAEAFTELLARPGFTLERIVSLGQSTPADKPMVQQRDEWVVLLQGSAGLRVEGMQETTLKPGDHLLIAAGKPHWVTWTSKDVPTIWLALHFD